MKTQETIGLIMDGEMPPDEIKKYLTDLSKRGESIDEIYGAALAMRQRAKSIKAPENALDCCGTGGDGAHSLNISTAVAIISAACGIPIAKHGGRASSSKCGAADVLEELGVSLQAEDVLQEKALSKIGFAFLFAPNYHPSMANVAKIRKELGFRTIFNLLGPLVNPAGAKFQLLGVFDDKWRDPIAGVLKQLGTKSAWVVHGQDGLDEVSISCKTNVTVLNDGEITHKTIEPLDFGLPFHDLDDLKGGDAKYNASALLRLLDGEKGAYRDCVLINTASALVVSRISDDIKQAVRLAEKAIDSGDAKKVLDDYIRITNERT